MGSYTLTKSYDLPQKLVPKWRESYVTGSHGNGMNFMKILGLKFTVFRSVGALRRTHSYRECKDTYLFYHTMLYRRPGFVRKFPKNARF